MVSQCPPEAEDPALARACAAEGESCQYDELLAGNLRGCCPGTVCKLDSSNTPSCVPATPEEREAARQCEQFAASEPIAPWRISGGSLETSVGTLVFDEVDSLGGSTGPAGCVTGFDATLESSAGGQCALFLDVNLVDGVLRVRSVGGVLSGCRGYKPNAATPSGLWNSTPIGLPEADVTFTGAACDRGVDFESYCVNGVFDFFFHGVAGQVTIQESHLLVEGTWCTGVPRPSCPIPAQ